MKIKQLLLTSVTVLMLASGNVWAEKNNDSGRHGNNDRKESHYRGNISHDRGNKGDRDTPRAPEIDAASGTAALALLAGALLLVGERTRSRRS